MSRILMMSLAALLPLGFAWGAAAGGDGAELVSAPTCDIRVAREGGALVLEGLAFAPVPAGGSYAFKISQSGYAGGSSIHQGGDFEAGPGGHTSLGLVSLSDQRGYAASLTVHWYDGTPDCTRHVGTGRGL
jgi:curli production assembly/transport CsgH protein